jgi:acetyl esterase
LSRFAERLEYAALRAIAALPPAVQTWLSREPPLIVDGQRLDPQLQIIRAARRRRGTPDLVEPTHLAGRARFRHEVLSFRGPATPVAAVDDLTIRRDWGPLRVRHYAPPPAARPEPLLVYLHGGGFVIGDVDTNDEPSRLICANAGVHVLNVDYRLAPEHPFPAALDDTRAALRWAQTKAASLGADPARVAIGGDSAGANLATVTARLAAREGAPPVAQLLISPPTDAGTPRRSHTLFGSGLFFSVADRAAFTRHYLDGTGVPADDPRVSPLLAPDLDGLPPALVITAGFDILRDEGEAYAAALQAAGTTVRARRFPALAHGFVNVTGVVPAARHAMIDIARDFRALLDSRR